MYFMYSQLIYISFLWVTTQKQLFSPGVRRGVSHTYTCKNLMNLGSDADH